MRNPVLIKINDEKDFLNSIEPDNYILINYKDGKDFMLIFKDIDTKGTIICKSHKRDIQEIFLKDIFEEDYIESIYIIK